MFRSIFLLLACCLAYFKGTLRAQNALFEKITIEHGLSQGMIFDILQTRDGFLWVATKDGLNRYDGYNFKVFSNNPFDPFSIVENNATKLFEDSRGLLWVGLSTKGADVYESRTGRFHHFPIATADSKIYNATEVTAIAEADDGSIWCTQRGGGVWRVAVPTDWQNGLPDAIPPSSPVPAMPVPVAPEYPDAVESILDLVRLTNGEMLVTSSRRQLAFDPKTLAQHPVNQALWSMPSPGFNFSQCAVHSDADGGDAWFYRIIGHDERGEFARIHEGRLTVFPMPEQNSDLRWIIIVRGDAGHSWLTLNGKAWDLAPGEAFDAAKPDFEFDQNITCAHRDRTGNLWFGTNGYGLRKLNPAKHNFHAGAAGNSLGKIWASGGLYFVKKAFWIFPFDPQTGRLFDKIAFGGQLSSRQVNLTFEPSGGLWLLGNKAGAANGTLAHFAPGQLERADKTYEFEVTTLNEANPLLRARDGRLWVGAGNGRLVRFDPVAEHFDYFDYGHLFGQQANALTVFALAEDAAGKLWIGTQLGLVKCTPTAQKFDFQLIATDPNNPDGLNNNTIACILPTPDDQLWLGTKGGGINILDEKTGMVRHITTDDGLLNNVVYGILPGNSPASGGAGGGGEYWCSTNRGLAKIVAPSDIRHPTSDIQITTFTAALGLQDNEFNTHAYCKTEAGELLFGGVNGLNRFFPDALRADTTPPPVLIVGVEINRQKSDIPALEHLRKLALDYDENNLSLEFSALDFTDPSKNRYRYRLVGLEDDWVEAGAGRFAHYTHLAPGRYEFRVQGSNGESAWSDAAPLTIVVHPPWWRSNLAYFCYIVLLAWAAWRAYQFQIGRVKEREQLAFEHRETERVKVLEQLKTNFFNNVTHELRTPLTLMLEPLRRALPNITNPDALENVKLAENNSRKLLGLVNQLLDMAKIETGQMALDIRRGNISQKVRDVFETFLPLAEKRGIKLTLSPPPADLPDFDFDAGRVELVLNNLISNALKFTPEGGMVRLTIDDLRLTNDDLRFTIGDNGLASKAGETPRSEIRNPKSTPGGEKSKIQNLKSKIEIRVSDTGIGIAPEHLDKIFDRFYQVDGSYTRAGEGTGIGLALSKELAELMGGGISVESELGKGTTFTFAIPVRLTNDDLQLTNDDLRFTIGEGGLVAEAGGNPKSDPYRVTKNPKSEIRNLKSIALIIEDNAELRNFIKKSIATAGWQVVEASDGEEGIQKAMELVPDLVVSDVMMPRKDGFAVVDALKNNELTAHIPIVLLTAKSSIESKLKGLLRGADDYLTKPFSTEELLARMDNLLEQRRRLRVLFGGQNLPSALASVSTGTDHTDLVSEPDRTFLQKFTLLLEENLDNEAISVEDFAQKMLFSRSQLHRKLRALTDKSPTDFVRDYRLDRAYAMLKNREGRVGEVALRVGFGNEKYFSTVFREKFGVSPSQIL